ncbi:hypothetical protein FAM09_17095 [Niastella caeni]|uniref:DUF5689 domain-containing protein n=1 Tax=Niastella caeni TaxID=2569763 RepID=A0A4S8HUR6_9BACT|nr:DUF5689 domain-containing protein [Niastella caeni]THU38389.1 hypothetical protein FAM09_17095 [Niastella caeni]
MKKSLAYTFSLLSLVVLWACKKDNYPGGEISPYLAIYDVRNLFKGNDVVLSKDNMFGSTSITGVVVSDHSGNNLPNGLLILQDSRRLSLLRGISVAIGDAAASYKPGDSVVINVEGGTLTRVDGILQITNLTNDVVTKVSSGNVIPPNRIPINLIIQNPDNYESTLGIIVKANFSPLSTPADVLAGDKTVDDTFGQLTLHTESNATFANNEAPFYSNFCGILFNKTAKDGNRVPQFRLRTGTDVVKLSSAVNVTPVLITGFISDVIGTDADYEYMQFMATRDIDFAVTPFSVVTTNNAGASTPAGFPANGWATGGLRTYKFNLTAGKATKGSFFYVGGTKKLINGASSTNISSSNWIRAYAYGGTGEGFGTGTTNLLANSGNAFGMAIFEGTNVTAASVPVDVVFIGTGGSLYSAGKGYPICNSDYYDIKNPITLADQPYYQNGTNTLAFSYYGADLGIFNKLSGTYDLTLGRWTKARTQVPDTLTKTSPVSQIESNNVTILK